MVSIDVLWINLKETIETLGAILIIPITIIAAILVILVIIEKKLLKKIRIMKSDRNIYYNNQLNKINQTNSENDLKKIDKIARDFFKEHFNIKHLTEYSQLEDFFRKKDNEKAAKFCNSMNDILYSGKKTNKKINQELISDFSNILETNPIINKQKIKESLLQKIRNIELRIRAFLHI